jgi:hypothetical protein
LLSVRGFRGRLLSVAGFRSRLLSVTGLSRLLAIAGLGRGAGLLIRGRRGFLVFLLARRGKEQR